MALAEAEEVFLRLSNLATAVPGGAASVMRTDSAHARLFSSVSEVHAEVKMPSCMRRLPPHDKFKENTTTFKAACGLEHRVFEYKLYTLQSHTP